VNTPAAILASFARQRGFTSAYRGSCPLADIAFLGAASLKASLSALLNPSESKRAHLFAAIDRLVTAGVPMLVTGNLSPRLLEEKLGEAIGSRILDYSLGRTHELDGPDRRMSLDV
jgi:hypothetical protein